MSPCDCSCHLNVAKSFCSTAAPVLPIISLYSMVYYACTAHAPCIPAPSPSTSSKYFVITIIIVNLQATQLEMTVGSGGLEYYDISLVVSVTSLSSCSLPNVARTGVGLHYLPARTWRMLFPRLTAVVKTYCFVGHQMMT